MNAYDTFLRLPKRHPWEAYPGELNARRLAAVELDNARRNRLHVADWTRAEDRTQIKRCARMALERAKFQRTSSLHSWPVLP